MIVIGYAAVNRTYSRTLGFVMKPFTFSTFARNYIIYIIGYWCVWLFGINFTPIRQNHPAPQACAVFIPPVISTLINSCIWTLRLTCPTVYTFIGYYDCHSLFYILNV